MACRTCASPVCSLAVCLDRLEQELVDIAADVYSPPAASSLIDAVVATQQALESAWLPQIRLLPS